MKRDGPEKLRMSLSCEALQKTLSIPKLSFHLPLAEETQAVQGLSLGSQAVHILDFILLCKRDYTSVFLDAQQCYITEKRLCSHKFLRKDGLNEFDDFI